MNLQPVDIEIILWLDYRPSSILELSDAKTQFGPLEILESVHRLENQGLIKRPSSKQWSRLKLAQRIKTDKQLHQEFVSLRPEVLERDAHTCALCQKLGNVVHHIDYNKANNLLCNLITLCRSCHGRTNSNREYWQEQFDAKLATADCRTVLTGQPAAQHFAAEQSRGARTMNSQAKNEIGDLRRQINDLQKEIVALRKQAAIQAEQLERLADAIPSADAHDDAASAYLEEYKGLNDELER